MKIKLLKPIIALGAFVTPLTFLSACSCSSDSTSIALDQFYKYVDQSGEEMMWSLYSKGTSASKGEKIDITINIDKIPDAETNPPLGLKIVNEEMGDEPVAIEQMVLYVNDQVVESVKLETWWLADNNKRIAFYKDYTQTWLSNRPNIRAELITQESFEQKVICIYWES